MSSYRSSVGSTGGLGSHDRRCPGAPRSVKDSERPEITSLIKIYGERNTGTNYLQQLLKLNLDTPIIQGVVPKIVLKLQRRLPGNEWLRDLYFWCTFGVNLGWKHMRVPPPASLKPLAQSLGGVVFTTLTKNPYSWLLSLYSRPYHCATAIGDFERFLSSPWKTVARERSRETYDSPVSVWNDKNRSYIELREVVPVLNFRYEDLLVDPESIVSRIADEAGSGRKPGSFTNVNSSTKKDSFGFAQYQDYYLNERWKEKLSSRAIALINERLDLRLVHEFGYEVLG